MIKKIAIALSGFWIGSVAVHADVSEMIFYPEADFSEGLLHFNYIGEKNKNYAFMFDRGFDMNRVVYVRPGGYSVDKMKNGMVKLSFANTDRYTYIQRAFRDDFVVSEQNGVIKILLSGGDCKGSPDCTTAENILTVNIPKGYVVRKYEGLDQDLKELKNPLWEHKGNTYTLIARDVKGASIMMEIQRAKTGGAEIVKSKPAPAPEPVTVAIAETPKSEPAPEVVAVEESKTAQVPHNAPVSVAPPKKETVETPQEIQKPAPVVVPQKTVEAKPEPVKITVLTAPAIKTASSAGEPASYFRNFQLFENQAVVALSESGKERLKEWAQGFKAGGYTSVQVNAYTDNIPPKRLKYLYATNEILSLARAKAVAEYLQSLGIESSKIIANGYGDADPTATNDTEEGRSKNRRIEFVLKH